MNLIKIPLLTYNPGSLYVDIALVYVRSEQKPLRTIQIPE
jgi:hypothetical protein